MKIDNLAKLYYEEAKASKASKAWRYHLKMWTGLWGERDITEITARELRLWINQQKLAKMQPQTILCKLATLRCLYKLAIENGVECNFPAHGVRLRPDNERMRILSPKEREALFSNLSEYGQKIVMLALNTGMRTKELFELKLDQIDFYQGLIHVNGSKNTGRRIVPMNAKVRPILKKLVDTANKLGSEWLINPPDWNGQRKNLSDWWKRTEWESARRRSGLRDYRFHDLRHEFGTALAKADVGESKIQRLMGHKTPKMTQRYINMQAADLRSAVGRI